MEVFIVIAMITVNGGTTWHAYPEREFTDYRECITVAADRAKTVEETMRIQFEDDTITMRVACAQLMRQEK